MNFYSSPTGKLYKKKEKKGRFYRNLADNVDNFLGSDFYGQIASNYGTPSGDIQKYILATSDFAKGMQTEINHDVT